MPRLLHRDRRATPPTVHHRIPARRLIAAALLAAGGCAAPPELRLAIRLPDDRHLLSAVTELNLSALRDGVVLARGSFAAAAGYVSLAGVSHGPRTVITLDGVDSRGNVIARGRTCPLDFEAAGTTAALYFAPTNFFAPTAGAPAVARDRPVALPLGDGTVLIVGGADPAGAVVGGSELFVPGAAAFHSFAPSLGQQGDASNRDGEQREDGDDEADSRVGNRR